jgi:anti-sigma B factor antagonist
MTSPIEITIDDDGTTLVVRPVGEVDMYTSPHVEQSLLRCTNGHRDVVVDVSGVEFMDSTGLQMLIEAHRRDARFALGGHSDAVERLLELTGTAALFRRSP